MTSNSEFSHSTAGKTGILLVNLGTPDEPTSRGLRRYLKQFLWDPRVVDLPRIVWWFMLQLILILRPAKSAHAYQQVWTDQGSPLLVISKKQQKALQALLNDKLPGSHVELAMSYGSPSIPSALQKLQQVNVQRLLVLPLYPQYSASTTASVFDAIAAAVKTWRWVPEMRFVNQYHDNDDYIQALANSIKQAWQEREPAEKLLFSFHGTPKRFLLTGDPYHCMCHKTARLVAEKLQLREDQWQLSFQSIFGREEWLKPYTIDTLAELAQAGVNSIDVVCPGFSADCLETLEEIEILNREAYLGAGGGRYHYIPALNDRPDHVDALSNIVMNHVQGWPASSQESEDLKERLRRAKSMGAES